MFNNLNTLVIDGKTVVSLSINGRIVFESDKNKMLMTADDMMVMTSRGRRFVVKSEEMTNGKHI